MSVYEAGLHGVEASEYVVEDARRRGFEPMRYKPLDDRWIPMVFGAPEFSVRSAGSAESAGRWVADAAVDGAAPLGIADLESPLRDARPREWVRHAVTKGDGSEASARERLSMVAAAQGPHVEMQTETVLAGGSIPTGTQLEHADVFLDVLLDFAASDEALRDIAVRECTVTRGSYESAGRRFPAVRVEAQLAATRVMRHQDFPASLAIDCVISAEVPVHGVLEAQLVEETVWRAEPPEERSVSRWISRFELLEFGLGG
jgi:hypothetical protein